MGRRKSSRKNQPALPNGAAQKSGPSASPSMQQEDAALWAQVTKSLTPLKGPKDRLHFGPLLDEKPSNRSTSPLEQGARDKSLSSGYTGSSGSAGSSGYAGGAQQASQGRAVARGALNVRQTGQAKIELPQQSGFSRRELRQIDKGHRSIDARLDLHGLRQAGAHIALRGFLVEARARGFRHVLVITGKGRSGPFDEMGRGEMMFGEQEPGILRRLVPLWLGEPELREIVAGFSDAPRRHGGEGALYVRLRRNRSMV